MEEIMKIRSGFVSNSSSSSFILRADDLFKIARPFFKTKKKTETYLKSIERDLSWTFGQLLAALTDGSFWNDVDEWDKSSVFGAGTIDDVLLFSLLKPNGKVNREFLDPDIETLHPEICDSLEKMFVPPDEYTNRGYWELWSTTNDQDISFSVKVAIIVYALKKLIEIHGDTVVCVTLGNEVQSGEMYRMEYDAWECRYLFAESHH
jgi:hypothetical protein